MFSKLLLVVIINFIFKTLVIQAFVQNNDAEIHGFTKEVLGKKLDVFLGIPYAQPPIGELRFQKPRPITLIGQLDATKWPNPCWQRDNPEFLKLENRNYSEDCLYLNIWAPKSKELKPVIFWIHGGGLLVGSSNDLTYEGDVLAARGDVVVVTISYRLNALGFMFSDSEELPGNVGLQDQQLAMKWVQNNIIYFGGDPKKVTIIGQSAGGWSVSSHFLSPGSRNLFNNGIAISSSVLDRVLAKSREEAKEKSLNFAKSIGCADILANDFTRRTIQCLKKLKPEQFYASQKNYVAVVYGTEFMPEEPIKMIKSGNFKTNSQLMIGTTENEAIAQLNSALNESQIEQMNFSKLDVWKIFENNQFLAKFDESEILKFYISTVPEGNINALRKATTMFYGDITITCPTIDFAKLIYENDGKSRVFEYHYTFSHSLKALAELNISFDDICDEYKGSCHAYDLVSIFGWPLKRPDKFCQMETQLSERMIEMVASFSRFGHPAMIEGVEWPAFYSVDGQTAMPYYEFGHKKWSRGNFGWNLKQFECQVLFKKLLQS